MKHEFTETTNDISIIKEFLYDGKCTDLKLVFSLRYFTFMYRFKFVL